MERASLLAKMWAIITKEEVKFEFFSGTLLRSDVQKKMEQGQEAVNPYANKSREELISIIFEFQQTLSGLQDVRYI